MTGSKPETYWEHRTHITEEALQHLAQIIVNANPMLRNSLQSWSDSWTQCLKDLENEPESGK